MPLPTTVDATIFSILNIKNLIVNKYIYIYIRKTLISCKFCIIFIDCYHESINIKIMFFSSIILED